MALQVPAIFIYRPYSVDVPHRHKVREVLLDGREENSHHGRLLDGVNQV